MSELSDDEVLAVWSVADVLVPATERMPSLRAADPDGAWLARTLAANPDLLDELHRILVAIEGIDVSTTVRELYGSARPDFDVLSTVIASTYYLIPRVRQLIGYPGQTRNPPRLDEAAEQLEDLLEQAMTRPSFYRPSPSVAVRSPGLDRD